MQGGGVAFANEILELFHAGNFRDESVIDAQKVFTLLKGEMLAPILYKKTSF